MKIVYQTDDGCVFGTQAEAAAHEYRGARRDAIGQLISTALVELPPMVAAALHDADATASLGAALTNLVFALPGEVASAFGLHTEQALRDEIKLALASGMAEATEDGLDISMHMTTPDFVEYADSYVSTRLMYSSSAHVPQTTTKEQV